LKIPQCLLSMKKIKRVYLNSTTIAITPSIENITTTTIKNITEGVTTTTIETPGNNHFEDDED
jgi:hypothetical protein